MGEQVAEISHRIETLEKGPIEMMTCQVVCPCLSLRYMVVETERRKRERAVMTRSPT